MVGDSFSSAIGRGDLKISGLVKVGFQVLLLFFRRIRWSVGQSVEQLIVWWFRGPILVGEALLLWLV
ncbi:unnamed protein product [Arabis nemorensis]|uniref:Uncharacterized protein n=1 Tax=Arabis nemorensis TaxID=586526 RepID=A0A565CB47_9BRAS|nr:unnamed protein product [Arabis nemorensis]